jgi:hypothetical protein
MLLLEIEPGELTMCKWKTLLASALMLAKSAGIVLADCSGVAGAGAMPDGT